MKMDPEIRLIGQFARLLDTEAPVTRARVLKYLTERYPATGDVQAAAPPRGQVELIGVS